MGPKTKAVLRGGFCFWAVDEILRDYPLLDYQEVISSSRARKELFSETRSYLIDILTTAEFSSSGTVDGDMLSVRISNPIHFGIGAVGYLQFHLIVEVKENKMRFTTKNIRIISYDGYGNKFVDDHNTIITGGKTLRIKASTEYNNLVKDISKGLHDIAEGRSSSEW